MHYALTQNNIVTHILRVPPENIYGPEVASQYTPCGEDVQVGWLWQSGEFVAPAPEPEPAPQIPASVTRRQGRLALLAAGKLDSAEAAIAAIEDPLQKRAAQIEYEADTWERNNAFLVALWQGMGGTLPELDNLFTLASTL